MLWYAICLLVFPFYIILTEPIVKEDMFNYIEDVTYGSNVAEETQVVTRLHCAILCVGTPFCGGFRYSGSICHLVNTGDSQTFHYIMGGSNPRDMYLKEAGSAYQLVVTPQYQFRNVPDAASLCSAVFPGSEIATFDTVQNIASFYEFIGSPTDWVFYWTHGYADSPGVFRWNRTGALVDPQMWLCDGLDMATPADNKCLQVVFNPLFMTCPITRGLDDASCGSYSMSRVACDKHYRYW